MEIQYEKAAVKYLKGLQKPQRDLIRLRVGKYRIIYKYLTNNEIEVLCIMDVGSRGDIYK